MNIQASNVVNATKDDYPVFDAIGKYHGSNDSHVVNHIIDKYLGSELSENCLIDYPRVECKDRHILHPLDYPWIIR